MKAQSQTSREYLNPINLLVAVAIAIISYVCYSVEFTQIDTFNRDVFQLININKTIDPKIATVSINVKNNFLNNPLRYNDLESLVIELKKHNPKHIIFVMEPNDLTDSKIELIKIRKLLEENNIWLNAWITGRNGFKSFSQLEEFTNYKYLFEFRFCLDPNGEISPRRMLLEYYNIKQNLMSNSLKKVGLDVLDTSFFRNSFDYLNTKQIYTKSLNISAFGNYSAERLLNGELATDLIANKTVFVGRVDEFSLLTANNIFNFLRIEKNSYHSMEEKFYPASHIAASNANTLITGDYIKLIRTSILHLLTTLILISLFIFKGNSTRKLLFFLTTIPVLALFQTLLYSLASIYFDLSSTYVLLIALQYLLVPIFAFKIINDQRAEYYTLLNNSRIDTFLEISEKIAHDIRSPLSVINLLTSRLKFQNTEHEKIFKNSIERIESISNDLLKKYKQDTNQKNIEKFNLLNMMNELKEEKQLIDQNIKYTLATDMTSEMYISANKTELLRVFSNLLDNSIQALQDRQDQKIKINIAAKSNFIEIIIEDNGIGIPTSVLKILGNERFSSKPISTGNGIGILHAKRSIEQLGGSFEIKSSEGQYTQVRINLPR